MITVSSTHPGDWVYLIDFDPCSSNRDLYLGHPFELRCWVLEDDRFDNTPWGRAVYAECRSLVNDRVYLLDPQHLVDSFGAFLLGYPVGN